MRAPLLFVALLLLAGCVSPSGQDPGQVQVCLERGIQLEWVEPGASAGLLEGAARLGWAVETTEPRVGMPSPVEGATALVVSWRPEHPLPSPVLSLVDWDSEGTLRIEFQDSGERARDERLLRAFLREVGLADEPQAEAWMAALLDDAQDGAREASFRATPDLSGVFARVAGAPLEPRGLGGGRLESGAWSVALQMRHHSFETTVDGHRLVLAFDDEDQLRAYTTYDEMPRAFLDLQGRVARTFERMGLPEPTWRDASGGGAGC